MGADPGDNGTDPELDMDDIGELDFSQFFNTSVFTDLLSPYLGYEVSIDYSQPVRISIIRPSTPESGDVLVGVHSDCIVIEGDESFHVLQREQVIFTIPRKEWEDAEWVEPDADEEE